MVYPVLSGPYPTACDYGPAYLQQLNAPAPPSYAVCPQPSALCPQQSSPGASLYWLPYLGCPPWLYCLWQCLPSGEILQPGEAPHDCCTGYATDAGFCEP